MDTQVIREKQDMTYLNWSLDRKSSGTAGSFLKAYSELGGIKTYYKLSNYDSFRGVIGHESVNELIVDRLLTVLEIEHVHYQLIHADIEVNGKVLETYLCASESFRERGEDKQPIEEYYNSERLDGESPLEFCIRNGWENYIWQMFVVDFLILNRDRHGANVEVLRNRKNRTIRLAPLFDHGLSLLCTCDTEDSIEKFDVMADRRVQCYLGSRSVSENLKRIPKDWIPVTKPLKEADKGVLFQDLDGILPDILQEKIWEMIWKRWCCYEDICHSR